MKFIAELLGDLCDWYLPDSRNRAQQYNNVIAAEKLIQDTFCFSSSSSKQPHCPPPSICHTRDFPHKEPQNIFSKICFQDISILQEYWTWDICHKMGNKVKLTNLLQSRLPRKFKVFPSEIFSVFRRTINTLIEKSLKKLFFLCSIFDETNDMKRPINTEVHDH